MDVTPRELRDMEIREGFRGYNRDDVDELLERAALTIEGMEESARQSANRPGDSEGGERASEGMLQRTLLLAQRAADEAIEEAETKARQLVEEAEATARETVADAQLSARREAETQRRKLESEVLELGAKREALISDVDSLERFEAEYRARLRRTLEGDLEQLVGKEAPAVTPRPTIHDVDLPISVSPIAPSVVVPVAPVAEAVAPSPEVAVDEPPASARPLDAAPAQRAPLFDPEPVDAESLDDDAFFASLREAVTDETPLGPREDQPQPERELFDQDEANRSGGLFRRNRG